MKLTSRWKASIAALVAVGTVFGASAVSDVANALPAGTPPENGGGVTLAPGSGSFATPFNFNFNPTNQACPGDNTQGWFFSPYLTADDPAALTFSAAGSPISAGGGRTVALRDTGGNLQRNIFPNLVDGLLISFPDLSFAQTFATTPLEPGVYNVGIACFNANAVNGLAVRENARYWNTQITATGAGTVADAFAVGAAPAAPVLSLGAGTGTEQTINLVADSSVDSYTLDVTPAPGGALPTVNPGDTSFELSGLTLGTSYSVTLEANKLGFLPTASAPLAFTAAATTPAPVVTALNVFEGEPITASWTQPAGPVAPVSYDVELRQGATVIESQPGVVGLTTSFAVAPVGSYTVAVTPNYAAGSGVTGQTGTDSVSVNPGALIVQELTVARPQGALILTQRCGVYGGLPTYGPADQFPGFPRALPAEGAVGTTTGLPGTAPTDLNTGNADSEFDNYPLPNDDPDNPDDIPFGNVTECGLDMGVARFVTQGALAGQFFTADGRLNQVTVLDTRDGDAGWTLRGDIEDRFTSVSNGDSFSGDYLGWQPVLTDDSDQVGGEGPNGVGPLYDQTVTAATDILPGTGFDGGLTGLTSNPPLASAPAGAGLGIATIDARLGLLIPTSVDAADYSATLTLTVA